jgi:hypothetical protein
MGMCELFAPMYQSLEGRKCITCSISLATSPEPFRKMMGLRAETERKLVAPAQGEITPEAVAEWAMAMMEGGDEALRDEAVWNALDNLGGC